MKKTDSILAIALIGSALLGTAACTPEVGSESWCAKMLETPRGDWSANEMTDFAKHCVFK